MRSMSICATRRSRRIAVAAVAAMAVAAALTVSQSGVTGAEKDQSLFTVAGDGELPTKRPSLRDSRAPLSTDETGYAIHIASADISIPRGATDVRGEDGPEFLHADIPEDVDAIGRSVTVVLYDYTSNKTYHQLVDLKSGRVTRSRSTTKLQPPTSSDEAEAAITIAINAEMPPAFASQFERLEGVPLVSPEQVHYVAGAWVFDGTTTGGSVCGSDRCARLIVSTPSSVYLDTSDVVVNLSTSSLIMLEGS